MLESNVDKLLKVRTDIDDELRRQITSLTILFTDVVSSTDYSDRIGDVDSVAILQRHADLVSHAVAEFGGRVIKAIGDSVMAEFPGPVAGLRAAVAIQRRLVDLNLTLPERDRVELRIGIKHGPSYRHGDDIYGDAVNLAGRITKLSGPGQILVLRSVREAVRERGEFSFVDLGKVAIEGKTEMEDIFEVLWTDEAAYSATRENLTGALQRGELVSPGLKLDELVQPLEAGDLATPAPLSAGQFPTQVPTQAATQSAMRTANTLSTTMQDGAITSRYDILQELGRGGMGVVYKARDRETGDLVALKVLKDDVATDDGVRERFKNELRLARKITHKNVCRIHEIHRTAQTLYISMEYVDGESLRSILKRSGALSLQKCLNLTLQFCAGLQEAHGEGVVHRDLKPENLMVDAAGHLKIMDFGIARSLDSTATIVPGTVVGTPAYMSPEQAEGKKADRRTDIYALGLILFEMATGRRTFVADTPVALALKQIREAPQAPRTFAPAMPLALEQVILKCLEKDPKNRFQSVEELDGELVEQARSLPDEIAKTLRTVPLKRTEQPAPAAEPAGPPRAVAARKTSSSRWPLIAAGAIIALVIVIGGLKFRRTKSGAPARTPAVVVTSTAPSVPAEPTPSARPPSSRPAAAPTRTAAAMQPSGRVFAPPAVAASPSRNVGTAPIVMAPIMISTNPPGSQVLIDGKMQPAATPSAFSLPEGEHKITLRKQGFRTMERTVEIAANNPPLKIDLVPKPPETSVPTASKSAEMGTGRIVVSTRPPGAKIIVDGAETDYRSPVNFSLSAGKHTVEVEHAGFETETREVQVSKNSVNQFEFALKPGGVKKRKRFLFR
jgi:serine/threonine protein kinase/class 3 adenylate cyclase